MKKALQDKDDILRRKEEDMRDAIRNKEDEFRRYS
jgi:hypothetical protein